MSLDDALDAAAATGWAGLAGPVVNAMMILVAAGFVQGVTIGAVGSLPSSHWIEKRSIIANRENGANHCAD